MLLCCLIQSYFGLQLIAKVSLFISCSRGISKSSIDNLQPLPERPEEQDRLSDYGRLPPGRKRDGFDEYSFGGARIDSPLPLESERGSVQDDLDSSRNHSELSDSNMWSVCTGNLTGRSSVNSWGNDDVSIHLL